VIGIAAAVLANTRALSLLWLALAVIAAFLMFSPRDLLLVARDKLALAMSGVIALAAALGLIWLQSSNTVASLSGTPSNVTPEQAVGTMFYRTFDYAVELHRTARMA
jgi:NADH:ubiquinone oxidoreductase subunit 6 (subunit J)